MAYQKKSSGLLLTFALFISLISAAAIGVFAYFLFETGDMGEEKDIIINRGTSVSKVAYHLQNEGIILRPKLFYILLRVTNGEQRVRAGEFRFTEGMSILDALYVLYYDEPIVHQVTIPEGWTIKQIADILVESALIDKNKFLKLTLSSEAASQFNLDAPSLEGFLFPDTYFFSKVDGDKIIIETMVKRFFSKFTEKYAKAARAMGFSSLELVTLASIIEKETGVSEERELISSVFHNRLKKNMRLQSDPTTIYGIPNFNGNLTRADLKKKTPYNTYKMRGLPIGPISNPGWASLKAALEPATTNYFYFVSNNQGGHIFSKSYAEHTKYVNKYQKDRRYRRRSASGKRN